MTKLDEKSKIKPFPKAKNTARRGTQRFQRIAAVLRSKSVEEALRRGARRTTVRFCRQRRLIQLVK
jgi:hypothetical protein